MIKKYWMTLVAKERSEQILVHGHTVESDIEKNSEEQLVKAAICLLIKPPAEEGADPDEAPSLNKPKGWDSEVWKKMMRKSYKERLVTAAALLAAQIDVVIAQEEAQEK